MRRFVHTSAVLAIVLGFCATTALAQPMGPPTPAENAHFDAMVGTWSGTGTIMQIPVEETVSFSWEVGHQYLVAQSSSTMSLPDGSAMTYESWMVHDPNDDGTFSGFYMDNYGITGDFRGRFEGEQMINEWEEPEGGTFRGVGIMNDDGTYVVTYFAQDEAGNWVGNGAMTYTRVGDSGDATPASEDGTRER